MSFSSAAGGVCTTCGSRIGTTASGDLGCLSCLLRIGSEEEPVETMNSATPASFGAYAIARHEDGSPHELGRGAMGITFLAEDVSLQRPVALKIIKADFGQSGSDARERFMREARAAAALRHPHVATVYQFGMEDETGQYFCAMELVEGETLEERVRRTGPLDSPTVVEIARQVTAALAAAEARGLVHRDLKPGNIMVASESEDGKIAVKVIDFGVAKALQDAPDVRTLTHGGFVGTPAFASPEQLRGKSIDVRSDIYSLGATMWFLLTGTLPVGDGELRENGDGSRPFSPRLEQLKAAHVPARLRSLLMTMLAAEPAARPGTRDLANRLERIQAQVSGSGKSLRRAAFVSVVAVLFGGGIWILHALETRPARAPSNAPPKSIAVLPFENLSDDKKNAYFTEGVQDQILTELARISDLKVISRTSVMQYKSGLPRNLREIGQELGVAHLLEGSVQRYGGKVRVNAQLIDAHTDAHLWAHSYDRNLEDVLAIQTDLAEKIAHELQARLSPAERARIGNKPTENGEAYLAYMRAHSLQGASGDTEKLLESEQLYRRAIELDPNFALAIARSSQLESWIVHTFAPNADRREKACRLANRALELQPNLPEAHLAMGFCYGYVDDNYQAALQELEVAQRGLPNEAEIYFVLGAFQRHLGRWPQSNANLERAADLNPKDTRALNYLAINYAIQRNFAAANKTNDRALQIKPTDVDLWETKSQLAISEKGDLSVAKSAFQKSMPTSNEERFRIACDRADVFLLERKYEAALREAENLPADLVSSNPDALYAKYFLIGFARKALLQEPSARAAFLEAKTIAERFVRQSPADANSHTSLASILAYLGEKEAALRELELASELLLESKDAYAGLLSIRSIAEVHAVLGNNASAIKILEGLLNQPSGVSVQELKLEPVWDSLRSDPQFQALLDKFTPGVKP